MIPSEKFMQIKNLITGSDVKIMTITGQVVKNFNNLESNQNIIFWDGKSNNNNYLSSGIYYVVSYKNGKSLTKKLQLLENKFLLILMF